MMLTDKRCPAGLFCVEGLDYVYNSQNCTQGKYCDEGKIVVQAMFKYFDRIFPLMFD